jgi:ribose transport system substrate-binding protein
MLRKVFVLTAIIGLSLTMSACKKSTRGEGSGSESGSTAKKKVYFITKTSESEFWSIVVDGGNTAAKELGVELVPQAPVAEADLTKQKSILEAAISAKPAAIVLAPSNEDTLVPEIEDAIAKGIPVIIIDSKANTDKYTSFLASDNYKIGAMAADKMAEALTKRKGKPAGKVACVTYLSGAGSLEKRKSGFEETVKKKYPDIKIIAFQDAQGKSGETTKIVANFLTAYKDLDGVFANNQNTGDETVRALDMASKKGLAVIAVDAGAQEIFGLKNGFVDAIIVQKPWMMGKMGVEYAMKAINGETLEKFIDTGIVAITPEMIESGAAEEYLDPVKFHSKKNAEK